MEKRETKTCKVCGKVKVINDFYRNHNAKDNRMNICVACYQARKNDEKMEEETLKPNITQDILDAGELCGKWHITVSGVKCFVDRITDKKTLWGKVYFSNGTSFPTVWGLDGISPINPRYNLEIK